MAYHRNVNTIPSATKRRPSATKRGPGRRHKAGHQKASPVAPKGVPLGFVQRTNPARKAKHEMRGSLSTRQFRKHLRYLAPPGSPLRCPGRPAGGPAPGRDVA